MTTIEIKAISLPNQRIKNQEAGLLTLADDHLRYQMVFYANEPVDIHDHEQGWKEDIYNHFDIYCFKKSIASTELAFSPHNKAWCISLYGSHGRSDYCSLWLKKRDEAIELAEKINKWLFNLPEQP